MQIVLHFIQYKTRPLLSYGALGHCPTQTPERFVFCQVHAVKLKAHAQRVKSGKARQVNGHFDEQQEFQQSPLC